MLFSASSSVALAGQGNSLIGELSERDVFHANEYQYNLFYNEWHYFNVIDEEQGLEIVTTLKLNGGVSTGYSYAQVFLGYNKGIIPGASVELYPITDTAFSEDTPNVRINKSWVELTPQGYHVYAESGDGNAVFDAIFKPMVEPVQLDAESLPGSGSMSWLVASSKMNVDGTLTVGEKTYTLKNARGYHDHNWGFWNWASVGWDWGQVSQTKKNQQGNDVGTYSISFGNVTNSTHTDSMSSVLNVWKNKKVAASFNDADVQISHSLVSAPDYLFLPVPAEYPRQTVINATSDDGDWVNITFTAKQPVPLPIPLTPLDPGYLIIWEIIGEYEVEGVIDGKPVSFVAGGFLEYAAKF
ncbi:hypothetical protein [Methanolobus profundi]|uniref:hypothetical protein n=1 Tax=Methanolobus profundi TaxID=487685 RepID=UPI000B829B28|nr:hypothetical protein [Methanolobus profundi]